MKQTTIKVIPYGILLITGLSVSAVNGAVIHGKFHNRLLSLIGVAAFVFAAIAFLHLLSEGVRKHLVYHKLGVGRAAALRFIIRLFGYLIILFVALGQIGVPVGHVLVGSAVLGIILGVAAQQALGNFFASIILIISHPFTVGQKVTLISGGLGGAYEGTVHDIGLTHTTLHLEDGEYVRMPDAAILTGAAIKVHRVPKVHTEEDNK